MHKLMVVLGVLCLLVCCCAPITAETFANGYVNDDGYSYWDGYWYYNNIPYTRQQESYTAYRSNGYGSYSYPYTSYRWRYYEYKAPKVAKVEYKLPGPNDPQWRSKLLEIAKHRDEVEGAMRLNALENQLYLEAVTALGMQGNFNWQNYGMAVGYPNNSYAQTNSSSYQAGSFGVNGATIYGHEYSTISQLYGPTNLDSLYQQSSLLTKNAQDLAGQAHGEFNALLQTEGGNRARVADILARGQAAAAALRAAEGQSSIVEHKSRTFSSGHGPILNAPPTAPPQMPPASDPPTKDSAQMLGRVIENRCASCHGNNNPEAKLNMLNYFQFDENTKQRVRQRITTTDATKRMPLREDGTPAEPLPTAEVSLFFLH